MLNNGRDFPTVPGMSGSVALVTKITTENLSPSLASSGTCHGMEYPPERERSRDPGIGNVMSDAVSTLFILKAMSC